MVTVFGGDVSSSLIHFLKTYFTAPWWPPHKKEQHNVYWTEAKRKGSIFLIINMLETILRRNMLETILCRSWVDRQCHLVNPKLSISQVFRARYPQYLWGHIIFCGDGWNSLAMLDPTDLAISLSLRSPIDTPPLPHPPSPSQSISHTLIKARLYTSEASSPGAHLNKLIDLSF